MPKFECDILSNFQTMWNCGEKIDFVRSIPWTSWATSACPKMLMKVGTMSRAVKMDDDLPGLIMPFQLKNAGTRTPPSHVVPLPHLRGPAQPPRTCRIRLGLNTAHGVWKSQKKVSFNIASVASYVYILSGQKLITNTKKDPFGEFLKTWSFRSNSVTRHVSFNRTKIGGKRQSYKIQMRQFE